MDSVPPPPPASSSSAPISTAPRRGWFGRNWKWFVPMGCLGMLGLLALFIFMIVMFAFGVIKSSEAYKTAVEAAKANPAVIEALGTPIEEGMFISGKTEATDASGSAELSIPISGPKGKAKIYVTGAKSAGEWRYSTLIVEIEKTGERINLTDGAEQSEPEGKEDET